jgi:hypothetical protein
MQKKSEDQTPKGEFTSVVTKGKSGNRGPESDAAYKVHNSPSELRHLEFYYKKFLDSFIHICVYHSLDYLRLPCTLH